MTVTWKGDPVWTVPNVIAALRLLGLAPLLWTAHAGHRTAFVWIVLALLASDWIDGKLATLLDQETTLGARFDSLTDGIMYAAIAIALWWLEEPVIRANLPLVLGVVLSWCVSAAVALARFRRLPSYHTRGAKTGWLVGGIALLALLLGRNPDLLPWALGFAILANLEAVAIGLVLPEWRANVASIVEAAGILRGG